MGVAPRKPRFLLVTDAWFPQVNGVANTWFHVLEIMQHMGFECQVLHPHVFRHFRAPRYPEIRVAICSPWSISKHINQFNPNFIHIATEGPIGFCTRLWCQWYKRAFTTSYHTQYPIYLKKYYAIPKWFTYFVLRWFHLGAKVCLVPTEAVGRDFLSHGIKNLKTWSRGVNAKQFRRIDPALPDLIKPVFIYVGRVAIEKNIEAFLQADLPGSKLVVGDGPIRSRLQKKYPKVRWAGYQVGESLVAYYSSADVLVFPSQTDTYGIVMLEANACGLPIAAYPVTGPIDVIKPGINGVMNEDLALAAMQALEIPASSCVAYAKSMSWHACANTVINSIVPCDALSQMNRAINSF